MNQKILKISKRLNRFTVDDLTVVLEIKESVIIEFLERFVADGQIRKLNASEYLFIKDNYEPKEYKNFKTKSARNLKIC